MADTSKPSGILARLKSFLRGLAGSRTPHPRWPHRTARWLDPNVPLQGSRIRVDRADAPEALRAIVATSGGRLDDAAVAEVLDAIATDPGDAASFRFGKADAFRQVWIGAAPEEKGGGVKLILLSDALHVREVEAALSVAGFHDPAKRPEYDRLSAFLVGVWEWRASEAPAAARDDEEHAKLLAAKLRRTTGDPKSPVLEILRALRVRAKEMVAELAALDEGGVAAVDAWLARHHAPTLTEMRRTLAG